MPGWGQILKEIQQSAAQRGGQPDTDGIRAKYITQLHKHTGRAVIVYASGWLHSGGMQDLDYLVNPLDVHAFMEVCHEVKEKELDLIIHSPGGYPGAAEQIMNYLRTRFKHIRALVPLQAKSAATMMALGCDEIVLGAHSELGPIDPQIAVPIPGGTRYAPAIAILRDFERAKRELAENVEALPAWTPILHAYAGGLFEICTQQLLLSQEVVIGWLKQYMLAHPDAGVSESEREEVAKNIAEWFGSETSYDRFHDHGRPIRIEELQSVRGLRVRRLEENHALQDNVLSIYHVLDFAFGGPAIKVVENHNGKRYVRIKQQLIIQQVPPAQGPNVNPAPQSTRPAYPPAAQKPKRRR
jgi:hypothetical protein